MWVSFTQIFKLHVALHKEYFVSFDGSEMSAKKRKAHHEKQFLIRALITADGNQSKAAEWLKMSKSNLSYKCNAYGIKQPNYYYLTLMRWSWMPTLRLFFLYCEKSELTPWSLIDPLLQAKFKAQYFYTSFNKWLNGLFTPYAPWLRTWV